MKKVFTCKMDMTQSCVFFVDSLFWSVAEMKMHHYDFSSLAKPCFYFYNEF